MDPLAGEMGEEHYQGFRDDRRHGCKGHSVRGTRPMNVTQIARFVRLVTPLAAALALVAPPAAAQDAAKPVARIVVEPASLEITAGQTIPIKLTAYDAAGAVIAEPPIRMSGARNGLSLSLDGVKGLRAGTYELVVSSVP